MEKKVRFLQRVFCGGIIVFGVNFKKTLGKYFYNNNFHIGSRYLALACTHNPLQLFARGRCPALSVWRETIDREATVTLK